MMELEIWAKRVELRWHAMIWLKIINWIPRWLPYNFRTHFKCSWNDTRLSNLQKLAFALSNAPAMTRSQAALYTALAMIWSQRSYRWIWWKSWTIYPEWKAAFQAAYALDHEIPISKHALDMISKISVNMKWNNLSTVKSCFLSRLWIESWNS